MIGHPDCQDFQLLDVDGKIAFQGSVVADTTKTVSYTHLDVYKRQAFIPVEQLRPALLIRI